MTSFGKHMGVYVQDQTKKGWLTSIFELGAWFGCFYSGFVAETLSRKYAIIANVGVFVVGVIVQCLGVGGGASCILTPEVRGSLVALQQLAITAGIMVSFWIDYGTNNIGGTGSSNQMHHGWYLYAYS